MEYYFYKNKKTGIVKFYDKTGKNEANKDIFDVVKLDITKKEKENIDNSITVKIKDNKLLFEESSSDKLKKEKVRKINKSKSLDELKQAIIDSL
jgi:hypothetical protein